MRFCLFTSVLVVLPIVLPTRLLATDWPGFLGGVSREQATCDIPTTWSSSEGFAWQTPLPGHGQSSPVVVGNSVYLTAVEGPQKETNIVLCFELESGKQRWRHDLPSSLPVKNDNYTCRAAPTVAADEQGVYAFFESGDTIALTPSGEVRWQRDLIQDYGKFQGRFGLGASLAQDASQIFILADNDGPSYLLALDKNTGETTWKTERGSRTSWSSPMIMDMDGGPQIVISSAGSIDGYNPSNGKLLWTFGDVGGNTVASPVPFGEGRFLVGASPGRNGENTEGASRSNMAIQVRRDGAEYQPEVLWRNTKANSSFGSPVVYRGHAYYVNRAGVVFCLDAATGETVYNARIAESIWATPVGIGDRIFFFGQTGSTTVLAAGNEYQELAVNRLWPAAADGGGPGGFDAEIQYGIALSPAGLLVRTGSNLYLIGSRKL
jgi:outer membrane protein assembly factor BamB